MSARSILLIVTEDAALAAAVCGFVEPLGWSCRPVRDSANASRALAESPAAVLVDQRFPDAPGLMAGIREKPAPINGTPILTVGGADRGAVGSGGQLDLPLDRGAFLALLRQWVGPVEDHASRGESWHFRYKLLRLLGLDNADAMLRRLRSNLGEAVERALTDGSAIAAHRLAGLAGICGFADVSQAWSRADRHEEGALAAAIAVSQRAMADIDAALGPSA